MSAIKGLGGKYNTFVNVWESDGRWFGCWTETCYGSYSESKDFELDSDNEKEALDEIVKMFHDYESQLGN